jgi:hypothetical protein
MELRCDFKIAATKILQRLQRAAPIRTTDRASEASTCAPFLSQPQLVALARAWFANRALNTSVPHAGASSHKLIEVHTKRVDRPRRINPKGPKRTTITKRNPDQRAQAMRLVMLPAEKRVA